MRLRRQLIIAAAFDLVAEGGLDEVTIRAVSRRSGIHRQYFRESFDSRDALLSAMFDNVVLNVTGAIIAALKHNSGTDADPQVYVVTHAALTFLAEHPPQAQVLLAGVDYPGLRGRRDAFVASFRMLISPLGASGTTLPIRESIAVALMEGAFVEFGKRWVAGQFGQDVEAVAAVFSAAFLELTTINQSSEGLDERAAALWRSVIEPR